MSMAFRFREDIAPADVAVEACGETLEELFASCAEALLATMIDDPVEVARCREVPIRLEDDDLEMLLFSFLEELVYLKDARQLLLHAERVRIVRKENGFSLEALFRGEVIDRGRHRLVVDVKAVTLFCLSVVQEDNLWKATVVLDV